MLRGSQADADGVRNPYLSFADGVGKIPRYFYLFSGKRLPPYHGDLPSIYSTRAW